MIYLCPIHVLFTWTWAHKDSISPRWKIPITMLASQLHIHAFFFRRLPISGLLIKIVFFLMILNMSIRIISVWIIYNHMWFVVLILFTSNFSCKERWLSFDCKIFSSGVHLNQFSLRLLLVLMWSSPHTKWIQASWNWSADSSAEQTMRWSKISWIRGTADSLKTTEILSQYFRRGRVEW